MYISYFLYYLQREYAKIKSSLWLTRLMQLAQQVKEVLPHVPLSNIRADLGKFRRSWQTKLMLEMM